MNEINGLSACSSSSSGASSSRLGSSSGSDPISPHCNTHKRFHVSGGDIRNLLTPVNGPRGSRHIAPSTATCCHSAGYLFPSKSSVRCSMPDSAVLSALPVSAANFTCLWNRQYVTWRLRFKGSSGCCMRWSLKIETASCLKIIFAMGMMCRSVVLVKRVRCDKA